ncbi:hypothetical protein GLW08_08160 [Pontibacillus yanchengensis]|uniref:Uncharacterized protein n=1 Tax=Pontibacillus yanchengensis TaxID=462910 RepID=A0ACC7VGH6_9BACI|nr:hypothetical protein [Pontibacillus yanchengensis]MYL53311.1 hypothetical protein [Pontibacillus yanchengensis]
MDGKYGEHEVVYCTLAFTKSQESGVIAAGVQFVRKHKTTEGKTEHEVLKVASLYLDEPDLSSYNQACRAVMSRCISELPEGTKLVIFHSAQAVFNRNKAFVRQITPQAESYGVEVKAKKFDRRNKATQEAELLANDAIKRKVSVINQIQ